jgi:aminopeptidase
MLMTDHRHDRLAATLVHYSCALQPGETVIIEAMDVPDIFTRTLVRHVAAAGANPLVWLKSQSLNRELMLHATEAQMELQGRMERVAMEGADAYIGIRGAENVSELEDVPAERRRLYEEYVWKPVHVDVRVDRTRWVVLRWPTPSMAQLAQRSTAAFEDFYFEVCSLDYARLSQAMEPLKALMERTREVRLVAPGTDLSFRIDGIPAVLCDGHRNIPDGEVYTAPVRDSVEGTIRYNAPSIYQGVTHEDVQFRFEQGRIVEADSSVPGHLEEVLNTDEGARYIGEFSIGLNPHIHQPMKDILFDEKIAGSIHFTPGNAYQSAFNGNRSKVHWDLVLMMAPEYGGGEIYFDGRLIRKDGLFVVEDLEALNPDRLIG